MAKTITGTLHYLETGQLVLDWGEGNFLALKFTNNDPDKIKTIKVGLDPSQGSGLVPLDEDMNGVFKITNKDTQKFVIESYDENNTLIERAEYDLSGLQCEVKEIKLDITSGVESSYVRGAVIPVSFEYNLKDIVEPENAVIKVGYRDDYNDTFIKDITPQTASGTITTSVNTNDMLFIYNTDIVVSVFNADGTVSYATDRTNTFEITEPQYVFNSAVITDGSEYDKNYFIMTPGAFTVEPLVSGDVVSLDFNSQTPATTPMLNGSLDEQTGIYSGTITGPNVLYEDFNIDIKVNDTVVCSFVLDGKRDITLDKDTVEIDVGESETVLWTPVNFGSNAVFETNSSGNAASAVLDTTNHTLVITGLSGGLATIRIDGWNNGDTTGNPDVHKTVDVTVIEAIPEGKTVTPTDDVQTLLNCAGIFDKSYTTINEVLADQATLAEIINSNNAVDYLVRSTTFASAVAANQTAMTDIGANNYAADTLLSNTTWLNAIYGSSYSSSVLNATVPQMTSNTAPSGVVTVSGTYSGTWKSYGAFNDSYEWYGTDNNNQFVQYEFPEAMTLKAFEYAPSTNAGYAAAGYTITLTGSNDGTNFTQLATHSGITSRYEYGLPLNETAYKYYKMHILCENPGTYNICPNAHKIQYYGRKDV